MQQELIDVVNEDDQVVGSTTYEEIYQRQLPHRIIHVFVFNDEGKLALQLRSRTRSHCPLHWSTSVGGHVRAGETYQEAAGRECREELGVDLSLTLVGTYAYVGEQAIRKHLGVFRTTYSKQLTLDPQEVEKVVFVSRMEIKQMQQSGEKFHPELAFLLTLLKDNPVLWPK